MVGMSGNSGERLRPVAARPRSLPALICGPVEAPENIAATSPAMVAVVASVPLL